MNTPEPSFPSLIWEREDCEVFACGPRRYRLLYQGRHVRAFVQDWMAILYAQREFLTTPPVKSEGNKP